MQKFIEMTPSERFQSLRKKGYSIKCLIPGAYKDKGKYNNRNSQKDLFANISHMKNIQSKSMHCSAMSTEVILKINSYCRNIKINA